MTKQDPLQLVAEWKVDYDNLFDVQWSPDGNLLAVAGSRIHFFDAKTFQRLDEMVQASGSLAFSADGHTLAIGDAAPPDYKLSLLDLPTRQIRQTLQSQWDGANAVAFAPDRPLLASGGQDQIVRLWDVGSKASPGKLVRESRHFDMPIRGLAFSPDGHFLALGNNDATARLWDLPANRLLHTFPDPAGSAISGLVFSQDSSALVSSGDGGAVVWDTESGQQLLTLDQASGSLALYPAGTWLASAGYGGMVRIWGVQAAAK
jgi:WD40 repeat protein